MIHRSRNSIKLTGLPRLKLAVSILSLCIALGLLAWSLSHYQPNPNFSAPRAIYSLLILSISLALLPRTLLLRLLDLEATTTHPHRYRRPQRWRFLFLLDITDR